MLELTKTIGKPFVKIMTLTCRPSAETDLQRCSYKKMFWKYAANLQENTHAEV